MTERSHKKGEAYQQDIRRWLSTCTVFGLNAEPFGDAYDVTKKACTIGGLVFDFSLTLRREGVARHVLYVECKFRSEARGNVSSHFTAFLRRAYDACRRADADEAASAQFLFASTIPPDGLRSFLRDRWKFWREKIAWGDGEPDEALLRNIASRTHVLVLSAELVRGV